MAKGVKYFKTVEKGDILTANETTKVFEIQENGLLSQIDTTFKGDLLGFYTGGNYIHNGAQYLEFLTTDSTLPDGSIDFNRARRYFKWDFSDVIYTPNPNYYYPDRPGAVEKEVGVVTWVTDNSQKLVLLISGVAIAIIAFWFGHRNRKKK